MTSRRTYHEQQALRGAAALEELIQQGYHTVEPPPVSDDDLAYYDAQIAKHGMTTWYGSNERNRPPDPQLGHPDLAPRPLRSRQPLSQKPRLLWPTGSTASGMTRSTHGSGSIGNGRPGNRERRRAGPMANWSVGKATPPIVLLVVLMTHR